MKKVNWQKYLSLILSFVIVFNVTIIPVFAEGETIGEDKAQEEQTEVDEQEESDTPEQEPEEETGETDSSEAASEDTSDSAPDEASGNASEDADPTEPAEEPSESEPEKHVGGEGKYVKDIHIAYAKTEEEAKEWLRKNKWEPLTGNADFNAGKASKFDDDVAAVMGIRRTDKEEEAITDLAVMNMKGGYSFPDYKTLLEEKKTDINEFINSFIPVLKEYRANYNGKGSAAGKKRAELAHEMLNRFYDGDKDDPYAVNDTERPLGDLFLDKLMQEGNEKGGDMQQIILESCGPAVTLVEVCLALAADTGKDTWLDRLSELSEDSLSENLSKYVPEAEGQDVAPSAVNSLLKQHFGGAAKVLSSQWDDIHDIMMWFEEFNNKNDLWPRDGESEKKYAARITKFFAKEDKASEDGISEAHEKYTDAYVLYNGLYEVPYEGEWGETLGDFFNPAESVGHGTTEFLPIAAALSKGQRASVSLLSLETLIMLGMGTEKSIEDMFPEIEEIFKDSAELSIYSGMNRGIFRGGVALTNAALMDKNQTGSDPFADMWSFNGVYNITVYAVAMTGLVTLGAGIGYLRYITGTRDYGVVVSEIAATEHKIVSYSQQVETLTAQVENMQIVGTNAATLEDTQFKLQDSQRILDGYKEDLEKYQGQTSKMTAGARAIMGVGGALIVAAALAKGYQMYKYYNKTFTQIPNFIVDEADIVSYDTDEEGNERKLIQFDQFVYYGAVQCNRQEVGEISDWQKGVSDYASWGCGDAADLNGDFGREWLALYMAKSSKKGDPILADSLTLQYGSKDMPEGCSKALHMFTYESAVDVGDTAYSFNNNKNGVYFFWDVDEGAFSRDVASAFDGGTAAMAGGVGLLVGIIGTAIVMRKKKEQ